MADGVLTEAVVNRALNFQRASGEHVKLGTILLNWDLLAEEGLLEALARHHRVPAAPWSILSAAPIEVTRIIPGAMAIRLSALPYAMTKSSLDVAFLDPSNLSAQDSIAAVANKRVIPAVALEIRLLEAHQKFYGRHISPTYRSITQKLDHRTMKAKPHEWQKIIDFRLPDPAPPSGTSISIQASLAEPELVSDEISTIEAHESPTPAVGQESTHFDQAVDPDDTLPRGASAHLSKRDLVTDLWRPPDEEESGGDPAVSPMWTTAAGEIETSMGEPHSRDEIGYVMLERLLVDVPRVLLFGCGKTAITGWQGGGTDLTPESMAAIRIPLSENNVFATVRGSGSPHFGPLESAQWPRALVATLGDRPPDCAVFPIRVFGSVAAFLYADRLGEPMHFEDFAVIARAAAATANSLARFLMRRNNAAPVG